jgi:hypothetical protein
MLGGWLGWGEVIGVTVEVKKGRHENVGIPSEFRPNPLFL